MRAQRLPAELVEAGDGGVEVFGRERLDVADQARVEEGDDHEGAIELGVTVGPEELGQGYGPAGREAGNGENPTPHVWRQVAESTRRLDIRDPVPRGETDRPMLHHLQVRGQQRLEGCPVLIEECSREGVAEPSRFWERRRLALAEPSLEFSERRVEAVGVE